METPTETPRQSKKVTPACEKCRVLKVKCIRPEEGQPCTKCTRSKSQCITSEPRQRQRARVSQRSKPRLADLESKLSNIIGLLSRPRGPIEMKTPIPADSEQAAIPGYFGDSPHPSGEWLSQLFADGPALDKDLGSSKTQNSTADTLEQSWAVSSVTDAAWITDLGLSPVVLGHFLDRFRGMASYFPFVRIPDAWNAASMAEDHPFLLLAAVAAASSEYCHIQDALIRKFKETLSQRVIINGEKDMDLLQGLLVHLGWFHFHFVPGNQQTYRYLQIGISMIVDLHLEQEAAHILEEQTDPEDTYTREACRAHLGWYYMSSIIAMSSGKPNNLKFHETMLRCAMVLQQQPEFDTDRLMYPITKVLHFAEEVCETYRSEGIHGARLYIHAERFTSRLEEWWWSLSSDLRNTVLLINSYYSVKIRIQEMGLVYCYGQRRPPSSKIQEECTILSTPPMVICNLVKCVNSTKEYLESFFNIAVTEHHNLTFPAWYQVILTIYVLYRLSVGLPEVPDWNVEIAQQSVNLQDHLDTFLSNLQTLKPLQDRQIPAKSLFLKLPEIIGSVRNSYAAAKHGLGQVDTYQAHHELGDSKLTTSSTRRLHRCPAMRYFDRSVQAPDLCTLQNAIAAEIQKIEDEKLWGDLLVLNTFSSMEGSSSAES